MPIFGKCCCCSLQAGCIVMGVLALVGSVIQLGTAANALANLGETDDLLAQQKDLLRSFGNLGDAGNSQLNDAFNKIDAVQDAITPILIVKVIEYAILYIPASICLIVGAAKKMGGLVLVWLVVNAIGIILGIVEAILGFVLLGGTNGMVYGVSALIISVGVALLLWLFAFSLRQEIQEEEAGGAVPKA